MLGTLAVGCLVLLAVKQEGPPAGQDSTGESFQGDPMAEYQLRRLLQLVAPTLRSSHSGNLQEFRR